MKNWRKSLLLIGFLVLSVAVLPSTIILLAGMSPTIVATLLDKTKERLRGFTVGCTNLAFCFYYWFELVEIGHTPENALSLLTPVSFSIMMLGAILGYMIEFMVTRITELAMQKRAVDRIASIKKQQKLLVERWGREVTGLYPIDKYGFELKEKKEDDF